MSMPNTQTRSHAEANQSSLTKDGANPLDYARIEHEELMNMLDRMDAEDQVKSGDHKK